MGRIRSIKPEFFQHEAMSALPAETHLLAAGLLTYADDEGYFKAHPELVRGQVVPLRESSVSVHDSLKQLANIGWLELGACPAGVRYGRIVNFTRHQRVNRPTPSKIKDLLIKWEASVSPHGVLSEPSLSEGKGREQGKEGKGTGSNGAHAPVAPAPAVPVRDEVLEVFQHWTTTMGHPKAKLDDKRKRAIRNALKLGYSAENLKAAIDGCKLSPFHQGQNDRSEVYDELTLVLRDAGHIDKFIRLASASPALMKLSPAGRQTALAGMEWLREGEEVQSAGH